MSLPNLTSDGGDGSSVRRRSSFPDSSELLSRVSPPPSECPQRPTREERRFIKTHQRSRSDTTSNILYYQPVLKKYEDKSEAEAEDEDEGDGESAVTGSWSRIVPASTGWYPRPRSGQSLVQFLSETGGEGGRRGGRAQLDRENAHFILSEAIISTFEQINFERCLHQIEEDQGWVCL